MNTATMPTAIYASQIQQIAAQTYHLRKAERLKLQELQNMKHEEIYHTCDRCGKRIRPLPYFNLPYRRSPIYIMAITEEHHTGIKDKINQADKEDTVETLQLEIETWYHEKKDKYELCGDCRKAFKKFMDNKEE